jgi:hypothetical protein
MLIKNAAQKIHVYAYDTTTGAPKTGDQANITGYVSLDGVANAIDDTNPAQVDATDMPGVYVFDLTAAETNCDAFALIAKSATANVRLDPIIGFTTEAIATAVNLATVDTVVDAIKVVTDQFVAAQAEPTAVPAANATPLQKLAWLAVLARNKIPQTNSLQTVKADDGTTTIATAAVSDDGTTFTRDKFT